VDYVDRPENVLRSDLSIADSSVKEVLTKELLQRFARDELFDELSFREGYHRLATPEWPTN